MELNDLVGLKTFSGIEMCTESTEIYGRSVQCNVVYFALDGITYKVIENPDDGYRSYLDSIEISTHVPKYSFEGVKVLVHEKDVPRFGSRIDIIVFRDVVTSKPILEVGTDYSDGYYPVCIMDYTPENMSVNQVGN